MPTNIEGMSFWEGAKKICREDKEKRLKRKKVNLLPVKQKKINPNLPPLNIDGVGLFKGIKKILERSDEVRKLQKEEN